MTEVRLHTYTGGLTVLVVAFALLNWTVAPENSSSWIAALITMPVIWLVAGFMMRVAKRIGDLERKFLVAAVVAAGSLMAFSLAMKFLGNISDIDAAVVKRAREVFMGMVLLYFGNFLPKLIGPSLKGRCSNAAAASVRRFSGWVLVIGALGYIGAWLFAPFSQASLIAQWWLGGAVGLVVLRIIAALIGGRKT
jgi:hypothetical protein